MICNSSVSSIATIVQPNDSNDKKYRNEIYRNSHLILKNYIHQSGESSSTTSTCSPSGPFSTDQYYRQFKNFSDLSSKSELNTYEARPINFLSSEKLRPRSALSSKYSNQPFNHSVIINDNEYNVV